MNRPANILLTEQRVPVFVDFGFAEKYNLESSKAFQSNLMYGTPDVRPTLFLSIYFMVLTFFFDHSIYPPNVHVVSRTTRVNLICGPWE